MPGALTLGALTTDNINFGVGTGLGDLDPYTFIGWFRPSSLTSQKTFYSRHNPPSGFAGKRIETSGTSGFVTCVAQRATTNTTYTTNSNPLVASTWNLMAFVYSSAAGAGLVCHIYRGGIGVPATECTYSATTDGTGALVTEATGETMIGARNLTATIDRAWLGDIGPCAVFGAALSLADITSWQLIARKTVGTNVAKLFGRPGKNGADWIEYTANAGTVTGATQSDGPPIAGPWVQRNGSLLLTRAA